MAVNTESLKEKLSSDTFREVDLSKMPSKVAEIELGKPELYPDVETEPKEIEYITGLKLYGVLGAITLVIFLMFLDLSIVATVSVI